MNMPPNPASRAVNRSSPVLAVAVLGFVVVAALVMGLRFTTTETGVLPPVTLPDPGEEPAAAVIVGRHQSGGMSFFGLSLGTITRTLEVQFYAPPGCVDVIAQDEPWPIAHPACAVDVPISGTISGRGIAPTGETIVSVAVDVSRDCYDAVALGDRWPPAGECAIE
jgi:hypothetical protein